MCNLIRLKETVLSLLFAIFKKALVFLFYKDKEFRESLGSVEGKCFSISVNKANLRINAFIKKDAIIVNSDKEECDLYIIFKNLCFAFKVFSGIISLEEAFAQKSIVLKGTIGDALAVTRSIKRLQALIFPDIVVRRIVKGFRGTKAEEKFLFIRFYISLLKLSRG